MAKVKTARIAAAIVFLCCSASAKEQRDTGSIAEGMHKALVQRVRTLHLPQSRKAEIIQVWKSIIDEATADVDLTGLTSDERSRVVNEFSACLSFGDISRMYPERVRQWKNQITKGLRHAVTGASVLAPEHVKKVKHNMRQYLKTFSVVLMKTLQSADRFAVDQGEWQTVKLAYLRAVTSNVVRSYTMDREEETACEELTTESRHLRAQYAELFIYTHMIRRLCNRVNRNYAYYFENMFTRTMMIDSLSQEQIDKLAEGLLGMEEKIQVQLEPLLSRGTFYFPKGGGRIVGYISVVLLSEKELTGMRTFDVEKSGDWVLIEKEQ